MSQIGDLGTLRVPPKRLRYRYNPQRILQELAEYLEKAAIETYSKTKETGRYLKTYCALNLPVPQDDQKILGDLPTKIHEASLKTVRKFEIPKKPWKNFSIYSVGFQAYPHRIEDIITVLSILFDSEKLNYLPFISAEVGSTLFSIDRATKESEFRRFPMKIGQDTAGKPIFTIRFKRERFRPPYKHYFEFLPYYLDVVDVMEKMFVKELYENRNLSVSRISEDLVWTRRTKDGKDIRISNPREIIHDLVPWGAFEYSLEDNKCWLDETNCRRCEEMCFPNVCFDLDPGERVSRRKLVNATVFIQEDLENEGLFCNIKHTGKRGYNIDAYLRDFKPPESGIYIPLKVLKHQDQMSTKRIRQVVIELSGDPYEVIRDYIRMKTDYWRALARGKLNFLVHDMSDHAGGTNYITVDAASVKRRSYHRAFYSLTENKTVCLPICSSGTRLTWKLAQRINEISKKPTEIRKHESELLDVEVKFNDSSFIRDFIEEHEPKIHGDRYERCLRRLRWII